MISQLPPTSRWLEHRGHRVLFADYGDLRGQDLVEAIRANKAYILEIGRSGTKSLLILTDVSSATISSEVLAAFKEVAAAMRPFTKASAVMGVTASRKFMLHVVNLFSSVATEPFDTREAALNWLVSQAGG